MNAIEFFSGIGGLHYACKRSGSIKVIAAFDVNTIANAVYEHNFKIKPNIKSIDSLTPAIIDAYSAQVWLLSPPCQPFTQGGKRLDDQDMRSRGLLNLINLLKLVKLKPEFIFLENVVNFEVSVCRKLLISTLQDLGYAIKEYLVSPLQFGIPNDRKRYYLAAKSSWNDTERFGNLEIIRGIDKKYIIEKPLSYYLNDNIEVEKYMVPEKFITKRSNFRFDVVKPTDFKCSVFTKAYGSHHVFGSGPMIQTHELDQQMDYSDKDCLLRARLRFFTPEEVARLHAFPVDSLKEDGSGSKEFEFPDGLTQRQKWQLLGNSLNVLVVSELIQENLLL